MSESIAYLKDAAIVRSQESRKKKINNMNSSTAMLERNGIQFESKNNGVHLIVSGNGMTADFWPSTGKFIFRGDKRHFRGVKLLIKIARGDYSPEQFKALQGERR